MSNCKCNCWCVILAISLSVIVGVVTAFLQVTGTITVSYEVLWTVFGIAVGLIGAFLLAASLTNGEARRCLCSVITTLIIGALGTVLFSLVLLGIGIVATSILTAIFSGLIMLFFWLAITSAACAVRILAGCNHNQ